MPRRAHSRARQSQLVLGWLLLAGGALFAGVLLAMTVLAGPDTRGWVETPCYILASEVVEVTVGDQIVYEPRIHYRYIYDGQSYRAQQYGLGVERSADRDEIVRVVGEYRPELRTTCFVNPADPEEAILARHTDNVARMVGFSFLASLVGTALIIAQWRGTRRA